MFSLLGAPYYRRHAVRCLLVVACMALTAAIHVGISLGNSSLQSVFRETLDRIAGRAQIQVTGAGGVPEELPDALRQLDCVDEVGATILRTAPVELPGETAIAFLGVDLLEDDRFRDYAVEPSGDGAGGFEDALILLAQPDSVLVTRELADRSGLDKGSVLPVWTGREQRNLIVRGLLANTEITSAYGGNLAVMDLYAAQHVFSRRGFFDRIDVRVQQGSDVESCGAAIDRQIDGRFDVAATTRASSSTQAFGVMYTAIVDASALLALLAALMLIHHASTVGVAQREREIAILLSLGASERRIRRFVLTEAALAGAMAGTLGLAIGYAAAHPLAETLQGVLRSARGVAVDSPEIVLDPVWAAGIILAAAAVAFVGAWGAANAAARVPPVQLAGGRRYSERTDTGWRAALAQAALFGTTALLVQRYWTHPDAVYVCFPLALAALWRLARVVEQPLLWLVEQVVAGLWRFAGPVAIGSLEREGRRLRGPLLAIAFSIAILATISGITSAYAERFVTWASTKIRVDFVVHSAASFSEHGALLSPAIYAEIRAADGVAEAARLRRFNGRAAGRPATLVAVDLEIWQRAAGLPPPQSPSGAAVTENFAALAGLNAGDPLLVETPAGQLELRVEQIAEDYTSESGAVYFDWTLYEEYFGDDAIEMIGVILEPSADKERARERIAARLPPGVPTLIADPSQISRHVRMMVDRWRRASLLQAVAVIPIAILAVVSFLIVSLAGKQRQLAILEALGAGPEQIRRCVWAELIALGLAGSLLGVAWGALLLLFTLESIQQTLLGFNLPFHFDWRLMLGLLAAGPLGAWAAAWLPAKAMARRPLVQQLGDD